MCSVDADSLPGYCDITNQESTTFVAVLSNNVQNQIQISNLFRLIKAGKGMGSDDGVTQVPSALLPHGSAYPPHPPTHDHYQIVAPSTWGDCSAARGLTGKLTTTQTSNYWDRLFTRLSAIHFRSSTSLSFHRCSFHRFENAGSEDGIFVWEVWRRLIVEVKNRSLLAS